MSEIIDFKEKTGLKDIEETVAVDNSEDGFEDNTEETENTSYETELNESDTEEVIPQAIKDLCIKQYALAVLVTAIAIGLAITTKEPKACVFLLIAVWLCFNAFSIRRKCLSGAIQGRILICTNVRTSVIHDSVIVGFRSDEEAPAYYQFKVGGKSHIDDFCPNGMYLVYFDKEHPTNMLAYTAL